MRMTSDIERCFMLDFKKLPEIPPSCKRIYFGHETCEKLLPKYNEISDLLNISDEKDIELTFVTPFLSEKGFEKAALFLDELKSSIGPIEVVSSDWGLINWMASNKVGIPVISRFLVGQQVDFRLSNLGENMSKQTILMDGKYYQLTSEKLSDEMKVHLESCALLKKESLEMFDNMGINRFELNNILRPIKLPDNNRVHFSLHVPFVPLTIFRTCPEAFDFNNIRKSCNALNCNKCRSRWQHKQSGKEMFWRDNALYYSNQDEENQISVNKSIDRIIYSEIF
jgi:hypothetical protein